MFPDCNYPDFIEDSADCVAWVKNNISKYGSCKGIYVGGSSAGGYLSMMLCFDKRWYEAAGISNDDISGYVHDAGQPTAHFNVLKYNGVDPRRVIVDETSPLYHIGEDKAYPPMLFIVSDNDIPDRLGQTEMMINKLKERGYPEGKISSVITHGTHVWYVTKTDQDGKNEFANLIIPFINRVI
jgi:dipeptidyl aminopeptidase/acylaminoacyl peptidase